MKIFVIIALFFMGTHSLVSQDNSHGYLRQLSEKLWRPVGAANRDLYKAVFEGDKDAAQVAINNGAEINGYRSWSGVFGTSYCTSLLGHAIIEADPQAVSLLLKLGADPNQLVSSTASVAEEQNDKPRELAYKLAYGLSRNPKLEENYKEIIKLLEQHGADTSWRHISNGTFVKS